MQIINGVKVSFNFNLRHPKGMKASTQIYCVVRVGEKQIKLSLGIKVFPFQWDKTKQTCIVSANMGSIERENNLLANKRLNAIRCEIDTILYYLCNVNEPQTANEVESVIRNKLATYAVTIESNMSNKNAIPPKRTITATTLLKKAFAEYYQANGKQKESTIKAQSNRLKKFLTYIKVSGKGDTPKLLTQDGLNDYKEWLEKTANANGKGGATAINQCCQLIARLINDILCVRSEYRRHNLQSVRYVNIDDTRKKDDRYKRALTESELATFHAYSPKNEKEKEIKDLFTLQLQTGVRKGDLVKLVCGDYSIDESNGYVIVETEKEGITAVIEAKAIDKFKAKHPNGLTAIDVKGTAFESVYNNGLKAIFKAAGLTSTESFKVNIAGRNIAKTAPLCDLISNHFARHTFITLKVREGWQPDKLSYMTGHADDRMIKEVYEHLTQADKVNAVIKEKERLDGRNDIAAEGITANIIAAQQVQNYKLQKENEVKDLKNRLGAKAYELGLDIILLNQMAALKDITNPMEAFNRVFSTFPNENEMGLILNGSEPINILNERLKGIRLTLNDKLILLQT